MIPTQKAAVIFDPDVARSLVGGILGALAGERVIQGASFLKDYLNKPFASPLLTIIDDGIRAKGIGSAPFDGEGVPTQKRVLVEKGVVKGLLLKEVTGYGIDPVTGNFSGGATGFWIENGEIKYPVQGVTIAGNAFDILGNIDMIGNDLDMNRGMAAPTFRVKEMQIGGS